MKLRKNAIKQLRFDPSALIGPGLAIDPNGWSEVLQRLAQVRDEMVLLSSWTTPELDRSSWPTATSNVAFVSLPERLLSAYANDRRGSELGRLFRRATHLHSLVDRVVVVAVDGSLSGARSILESCCQPFWNELSRADRGSKPRIVFEDSSLDNDAVQGLLHLLDAHRNRPPTCELDRWALVVIGSREESLHTSATLQRLLDALDQSTIANDQHRTQLLVPVVRQGVQLPSRMLAYGQTANMSEQIFEVPTDIHGGFSLLSAAGLVPAAHVGVNIIELLQGAAAMTKHFAETPAESNLILQFAAVHHLLRTKRNIREGVLSVWSKALTSFGQWYSALSQERHGTASSRIIGQNIGQWTLMNSRDWDGLLPQNDSVNPNRVFHHVIPEQVRFDPLEGGNSDSLPIDFQKRFQEVIATTSRLGIPSTVLSIPCIDELHLGQLFQMMMLATEVEARIADW